MKTQQRSLIFLSLWTLNNTVLQQGVDAANRYYNIAPVYGTATQVMDPTSSSSVYPYRAIDGHFTSTASATAKMDNPWWEISFFSIWDWFGMDIHMFTRKWYDVRGETLKLEIFRRGEKVHERNVTIDDYIVEIRGLTVLNPFNDLPPYLMEGDKARLTLLKKNVRLRLNEVAIFTTPDEYRWGNVNCHWSDVQCQKNKEMYYDEMALTSSPTISPVSNCPYSNQVAFRIDLEAARPLNPSDDNLEWSLKNKWNNVLISHNQVGWEFDGEKTSFTAVKCIYSGNCYTFHSHFGRAPFQNNWSHNGTIYRLKGYINDELEFDQEGGSKAHDFSLDSVSKAVPMGHFGEDKTCEYLRTHPFIDYKCSRYDLYNTCPSTCKACNFHSGRPEDPVFTTSPTIAPSPQKISTAITNAPTLGSDTECENLNQKILKVEINPLDSDQTMSWTLTNEWGKLVYEVENAPRSLSTCIWASNCYNVRVEGSKNEPFNFNVFVDDKKERQGRRVVGRKTVNLSLDSVEEREFWMGFRSPKSCQYLQNRNFDDVKYRCGRYNTVRLNCRKTCNACIWDAQDGN